MLHRIKKSRVCKKDTLKKILNGRVNMTNIFLANKILVENEKTLYVSRCKELIYLLDEGLYFTLSDQSELNKLLVDLDMNTDFEKSDYDNFVRSNNIVTLATDYKDEDRFIRHMSVAYVENLLAYGIYVGSLKYEDLEVYLNHLNKFLKHSTKENIFDGTIERENIKDGYIKTNIYGLPTILDDLNRDKVCDAPLSAIYDRKTKLLLP